MAKWLDRALVKCPYEYCLCLTPNDLRATLKARKIPQEHWPETSFDPDTDARTYVIESGNTKLIIVGFVALQNASLIEVVEVIAHEAVHVWQKTVEYFEEDTPSDEFMAYSIQTIIANLFRSYLEQKGAAEGKAIESLLMVH